MEGDRKLYAQLQEEARDGKSWTGWEAPARLARELRSLGARIEGWEKIRREAEDLLALAMMAEAENDPGLIESLETERVALDRKLGALLESKDSERSAILTIRAGTGGREAQDWAGMLAAMYTAWAQREDRAAVILDHSPGEGDGTRSVTMEIEGGYPLIQGEHGAHRLVRISPFDRSGRRQTSMAAVEVLPAPEANRDDGDGPIIRPADVRFEAFRASGPGGQAVNKLATAVRLTHIPTGITAVCRTERSQLQNRQAAGRILAARVGRFIREEEERRRAGEAGSPVTPSWGHRVRSYVLHPSQRVTDHRTGTHTGRAQDVLRGWLDPFLAPEG